VHLDMLGQACERFVFVQKDEARVSRLQHAERLAGLIAMPGVVEYLGGLVPSCTHRRCGLFRRIADESPH
jgi:hypothetical protein